MWEKNKRKKVIKRTKERKKEKERRKKKEKKNHQLDFWTSGLLDFG